MLSCVARPADDLTVGDARLWASRAAASCLICPPGATLIFLTLEGYTPAAVTDFFWLVGLLVGDMMPERMVPRLVDMAAVRRRMSRGCLNVQSWGDRVWGVLETEETQQEKFLSGRSGGCGAQ
jgi:hypothetical protein